MIDFRPARFSKKLFWRRPYFAVIIILPLMAMAGFGAKFLNGAKGLQTGENPVVSIEARDVDIQHILLSFATQIGARLEFDPAIHGTLSIQATQSPLQEVMNDICTVYSCEWTFSADARTLKVSKLPAN